MLKTDGGNTAIAVSNCSFLQDHRVPSFDIGEAPDNFNFNMMQRLPTFVSQFAYTGDEELRIVLTPLGVDTFAKFIRRTLMSMSRTESKLPGGC